MIQLTSAKELMATQFPPRKYIVDGLLPTGLYVLAGLPKASKSLMILSISLAVANGSTALGKIPVERRGVLYLSLEDTPDTLQERIAGMLEEMGEGNEPPDNLYFVTEDILGTESERNSALESLLDQLPDVQLVVIDTLEQFRKFDPVPNKGSNAGYREEVRSLSALKKIANRRGIAIVFLYHTTKSIRGEEPTLMDIVGSVGIPATVDGGWILSKPSGDAGTLYMDMRVMRGGKFPMTLSENGLWTISDDAEPVIKSRTKASILKAMEDAGRPMGAPELAIQLGLKANSVTQELRRMRDKGLVVKVETGLYDLPPAHTESVTLVIPTPKAA